MVLSGFKWFKNVSCFPILEPFFLDVGLAIGVNFSFVRCRTAFVLGGSVRGEIFLSRDPLRPDRSGRGVLVNEKEKILGVFMEPSANLLRSRLQVKTRIDNRDDALVIHFETRVSVAQQVETRPVQLRFIGTGREPFSLVQPIPSNDRHGAPPRGVGAAAGGVLL